MDIDVSKLKAGDRYYNEKEGWVEIAKIVEYDTGVWSIYDGCNDVPLKCRRNGENYLGKIAWSITKVEIREQPSNQELAKVVSDPELGLEIRKRVVSDGGSSSYYLFPQSLVDLVVKTGKLETKDIIRHGFGNDNDFGNVFKALKRLYELKSGGGKDGSTAEYEVNKMKYFLGEILENM